MTKKTKTKKEKKLVQGLRGSGAQKTEPQTSRNDDNWWRKYTKEYQDEDLDQRGAQGRRGAGAQKIEQPRKSVVRFNDNELMPDMSNIAKEMENMFSGFFKSNLFTDDFVRKPAMPRLVKMKEGTFRKPISGMQETSDKVIITIELPGVKKDNIKIHVEGMNLIIEAQSQTGNEDKRRGFFSFSKSYTGFRHIVRLPTPVDKDNSQAHYEAGVLRIVLKKKKSRDSGDIEIE